MRDQFLETVEGFMGQCPSRAMKLVAVAKAVALLRENKQFTPEQIEAELNDAVADSYELMAAILGYKEIENECCEDDLDRQIVAMRWANGESINGSNTHTQAIADQLGVCERTIRNRLDKIQERYHDLRGWPLPNSRMNYNTGR